MISQQIFARTTGIITVSTAFQSVNYTHAPDQVTNIVDAFSRVMWAAPHTRPDLAVFYNAARDSVSVQSSDLNSRRSLAGELNSSLHRSVPSHFMDWRQLRMRFVSFVMNFGMISFPLYARWQRPPLASVQVSGCTSAICNPVPPVALVGFLRATHPLNTGD